MRPIADLWRPLSDEQKAPWVTMSSQNKALYGPEMANDDGLLRVPNKRAKKDPNEVKRSMPAFFFYSQENRPKIKVGYQNICKGRPNAIRRRLGGRTELSTAMFSFVVFFVSGRSDSIHLLHK